jgi:hypothetical protein
MTKNSEAESQALDTIVTWLTERHLEYDGGYPYDYEWIGDTLAIAGLDGGKENNATTLIVLKRSDILRWHKAALAILPEVDDMNEALSETAPEHVP